MTAYCVTFETAVQISPDDFTLMHPCMIADDNTTIGDIRKFYRQHVSKERLEVIISEAEVKKEINSL